MFKVDSNRVRELILQNGVNLSTFAKNTRLNVLTVKKLMCVDGYATIRTIAALAAGLNVPVGDLILKAKKEE